MTRKNVVARLRREKGKVITTEALKKAIKRRKLAKTIPARPDNKNRLKLDDADVQEHLMGMEATLANVPAAFVFNMDESGVNEFADAKNKKVLVPITCPKTKTKYAVARDTRHVTLVACIGANGTSLMPLVVVTHKTIRERLILECWDEEKVLFAHSESGYINQDIFMLWLMVVFVAEVEERRRRLGMPRQRAYLVMDNCSAHKSDDVVALLRRRNIEAVFIPPNSSHLFQPLDRNAFSSFKANLRSAVPEEADKQTERLLKILDSWDAAARTRTIKASFKLAGFVYSLENGTLCVSFRSDRAKNPEGDFVPDPPEPLGRRITIVN